MTVARSQHTATLLGNGNVLVTGGVDRTTFRNNAEVYDPAANTWFALGPMSEALRANQDANDILSSAEVFSLKSLESVRQ